MSEMYPIIRRVRRPLVPVEVEYCTCCGKPVRQAGDKPFTEGNEENKGKEGGNHQPATNSPGGNNTRVLVGLSPGSEPAKQAAEAQQVMGKLSTEGNEENKGRESHPTPVNSNPEPGNAEGEHA